MLRIEEGLLVELCRYSHPISCITLSDDENLLASVSAAAILILNMANNELINIPLKDFQRIDALQFSADNKKIFCLSEAEIFCHEINVLMQ